MSWRHGSARMAALLGLAALAMTACPPPATLAGSRSTTCHVRNVTQDTHGTTLKAMVAAAHDGDSLRVRGTCRGAIIGKDLVIRGVDDQAILTGRDRYRVLLIRPGATVTLRHLRITHGSADGGGGIANGGKLTLIDSVVSHSRTGEAFGGAIVNTGTLTLLRTTVRRNRAVWGWVGGIYNAGSLTLVDSAVRGNSAGAGWGGGIGNDGTLVLRDSTVSGNRSKGEGGGISNRGTAIIDGSTVSGNVSRRWGGGIHNQGPSSSVTLTESTVRTNRADGTGGGISNVAGDVTMTASTLRDNDAGGAGGGIHSHGNQADVTFTRSAIDANTAEVGGGIWNFQGTVSLLDSTVMANTAREPGGGIYNHDPGTITLDAGSSVTGNTPDDCIGTSAC